MLNEIYSIDNINRIFAASNLAVQKYAVGFNFSIEDNAIISAEARMLNELNQRVDNLLKLPSTVVESKTQIEASLRAIKAKTNSYDVLLEKFND